MLSLNLAFDVSSSGLDVVVMREVVDELYAFRDFGSGSLPGFLVFGRSPDASFPEVFLRVSSSAGLPDASFPEVFLTVSSSAGLPDASFPEVLLFFVVLLL